MQPVLGSCHQTLIMGKEVVLVGISFIDLNKTGMSRTINFVVRNKKEQQL